MDTRIYSNDMIDSLKAHLEKNEYKYMTYPKFVFLCGKAYDKYSSTNRGVIQDFMESKDDSLCFVLSEKLWDDTFNADIDLLTFEEFLAEVSDIIILFVESPGTYSELGAFSYADKLFNHKLILVIDTKYKNSKSFIMTGPVKKAKNNGAKIVYAPLDNGAPLGSSELRQEAESILENFKSAKSSQNRRKINVDSNSVLINSFILELLEIILMTQPISRADLIELYKQVKSFTSFTFTKTDGKEFNKEIKYEYILKLLETVGLIQITNNIITTQLKGKISNFMFKYYGNALERERNRLICRKYRYGGDF